MVLKKMDVVVKKRNDSNFSVVAVPLPSSPEIERPLDKTVGQDLLFGKVWKWLQDDGEQVSSIGLYGKGVWAKPPSCTGSTRSSSKVGLNLTQ